jgi:hypothetical protein
MKPLTTSSILLLSVLGLAAPAFADDLPQGAQALALFEAGKALWDDEHFARACEKFAESQKLEPRSGTLFSLGACYTKIGKLASAYSCYSRAEEEYKKKGNPVGAREARDESEALVPRIPKFTIRVPRDVAGIEGIVIKRNGDIVRQAQWDVPIFVDPGDVVIEVSAPNHTPFRTTKTIDEGKIDSLSLSPLAVLPLPPQKKVALGIGSLGVAGGIVGAVFGGLAFSRWQAVEQYCGPTTPTCGQGLYFARANELQAEANSAATISTVAFGVGLAAVGTAVTLWLNTPHKR